MRIGSLGTNMSPRLQSGGRAMNDPTRAQIRLARKDAFLRHTEGRARGIKTQVARFLDKVVRREAERQIMERLGRRVRMQKDLTDREIAELTKILTTFGLRQVSDFATSTASPFGVDWVMPPTVEAEFIRTKEIKVRRIAEETRALVEREIRDALDEAVMSQPQPSIGKLAQRINDRLRGSIAMSPLRAERIARTEAAQSANTGIMEGMKAAGVERMEWIAITDNRTRDSHERADGQIQPVGAAFDVGGVRLRYPGDPTGPAHEVINCFVPDTVVSGLAVAAMRVKYTGKVIRIRTAATSVTVTPNHPILTTTGMVAAGDLRCGMDLLSYRGDINSEPGAFSFSDENKNHTPARIDEVFNAIQSRGSCSSGNVRGHDFHGDGQFAEGNVDIVWSARELRLGDNSKRPDSAQDLSLENSDPIPFKPPGCGSFAKLVSRPIFATDSSPRPADLPLNTSGGDFDDFPLEAFRVGPAANRDTARLELPKQGGPTYAGFVAELLHRDAGLISCDEIIDIVEIDHCGHVYDLRTAGGWYVANGICCSNCRCTIIPA